MNQVGVSKQMIAHGFVFSVLFLFSFLLIVVDSFKGQIKGRKSDT